MPTVTQGGEARVMQRDGGVGVVEQRPVKNINNSSKTFFFQIRRSRKPAFSKIFEFKIINFALLDQSKSSFSHYFLFLLTAGRQQIALVPPEVLQVVWPPTLPSFFQTDSLLDKDHVASSSSGSSKEAPPLPARRPSAVPVTPRGRRTMAKAEGKFERIYWSCLKEAEALGPDAVRTKWHCFAENLVQCREPVAPLTLYDIYNMLDFTWGNPFE